MPSTGSLITKKVIAYSLKDLLKTIPYDKISIKDMMDHADYRRQTFYDHFLDKQDLLTWIYQQELTEVVDHFINYEHWSHIIRRLLYHFKKNASFYQQTMDHAHVFDMEVPSQLQQFTRHLLQSQQHPDHSTKLDQSAYFLAHGMTSIIKAWLILDMSESIDSLADMITYQLNQFIKK